MTINTNNYHQWVEALEKGILTADEETVLMRFLEANPDLISESWLDETPALSPDALMYSGKALLQKADVEGLEELSAFDYLAVKSMEEGLETHEQVRLSAIVAQTPSLANDLRLYGHTRLQPAWEVACPDKGALKRSALVSRALAWTMRVGVAAAMMAGAVWYFSWHDGADGVMRDPVSAVVQVEDAPEVSIGLPIIPQKELPVVRGVKQSASRLVADVVKADADSLPVTEVLMPLRPMLQVLPVDNSVVALMPLPDATPAATPEVLRDLPDVYSALAEIPDTGAVVQRQSLGFRILKGGVMVANLIGINSVELNQRFDKQGNVVAYCLKGENFQWDQRVRE